MARVFSGSGNTDIRTKLELAVAGSIVMHGGKAAPELVDRIMRDVAVSVSVSEIRSVSPTMLARTEAIVRAELGLADPANANKIPAKNEAETDAKTPASLVDELRKRDMRAQTNTSNGLPNGTRSSAQFTSLKDESNPAYLAAREFATKNGMGWAPPELLRLGPDAIKTMHAMGFDQKVYGDMTGRGKFKAEQVVSIAKFAKRNNMTPEEAREFGKTATDVSEGMGKIDPALQRRFNKELTDCVESNNAPEQRERLEKTLKEGEKHNPAMKAHNDNLREKIDQATQSRDADVAVRNDANAKADRQVATADDKEAARNAKAAAFDDNPAPPSGEASKPKAAEPQKPAGAQPIKVAQSTPAP